MPATPMLKPVAPAPMPIRLLGRTVDWAVITIGATGYTAFGERTFVAQGDRVAIAVYDPSQLSAEQLRQHIEEPTRNSPAGLSLLLRDVTG